MVLPTYSPRQFFPSTVGVSITVSSLLDFKSCSACAHAYRAGIGFPSNNPLVGCTLALATSFVFPALPIGYSNKQRVILIIVSIGYGYAVDEVALF